MTTLNAELYDALIAIKVPEEKARAAAEAITESKHLATKSDFAKLEAVVGKLETRLNMLMWMGGIAFAGVFTLLGVVISLIV